MSKSRYLTLPITTQTTLENAKKWLNIIRYGESGTVIQLQDDCEYRVLEIIHNPTILKSFLGPYYKKYILAYLPVDQKDLMQTIRETLIEEAAIRKVDSLHKLFRMKTSDIISNITKKGYEVGFFISHITPFLKKDFQPLVDLELLIRTSKNFSVLIFSEYDITNEKYSFLLDKCSFLYDHLIKYPMYNDKDARQFISHYSQSWNFSLPETIIKEIIGSCGGYLWLLHQAHRNLRDNPELTVKEALINEQMRLKLDSVWIKFTEAEKEIIRKVYFENIQENDTLTHEYDYLRSIKVIKEEKGLATLGIPLLSQVIEKEMRLNKFQLRDERIFIGEKEITRLLTPKERNFMNLMLSSKKKIVARDLVAQAIWGKNWEEKYSDWAIDRLAHRIRKKIKTMGIADKLLKTVKKKGFIFG